MVKHSYRWIFVLSLSAVLVLALTLFGPSHVKAQPQEQFPILDKIADKVIQKYQNSTCEQLWEEKAQAKNKPKSAQEQEAISILRNNPLMRTTFINKIAAPIANKMFECGMIP